MLKSCSILLGDARAVLPSIESNTVQACITSPPYFGLRDYGHDGQIGVESTLDDYMRHITDVFLEVLRTLRPDGTLWLNIGDTYANDGKWGGSSGGKHRKSLHGSTGVGRTKKCTGLKPKDLIGVPWRIAFALQQSGWWLRQDIIWSKPNPMPESVKDRCTKAHEYLFLFTKNQKYYFDAAAIREPNANRRSVWSIAPTSCGEHAATFPPALVERCILAGSRPGDTVLDPFAGSGTTLDVATRMRRRSVGIEISDEYIRHIEKRMQRTISQYDLIFDMPATNPC